MSVRVRLTRVGSKKNPIWRVVVTDQRSPRDGRFIETVGRYNPQTDPSTIVLDEERLQHWIARGAQPTGTVKQLMKAHAKGIQPESASTATVGAAAATPEPQAQPDPEAPAAGPEGEGVADAEPVVIEASDEPVPDPAADEASAPEAAAEPPAEAGEPEADADAAEAQPDAAEPQLDAEPQPDADSQ